jgi:hypothetical protein
MMCLSVAPSKKFHGDEGLAVGLTNIVDGADTQRIKQGCNDVMR